MCKRKIRATAIDFQYTHTITCDIHGIAIVNSI